MLSVGIPAYNSNVSELLSALADQASHLPEVLEIIVLDDASEAPIKFGFFATPSTKAVAKPEIILHRKPKVLGFYSSMGILAYMTAYF